MSAETQGEHAVPPAGSGEHGPIDVSPLRVSDSVVLRALRPDDDRPLVQLVEENQEFLARWLPWAHGYSLETARTFIVKEREGYASGASLTLGLEVEGQLAGVAGFNRIDRGLSEAEIGYWLAERHNGRGIMTRACRTLINHAFEALGLRRIVVQAAAGNGPSRAIPERLGFRLEDIAQQARYALSRCDGTSDD